jgi:hypothetical protein
MFLTYPIKAYAFEYPLIRLEADQSDASKVSVPFLEGAYPLYLAWIEAQVPAIVAEEPIVEEPAVAETAVVAEPVAEEPIVAVEEPAEEPVAGEEPKSRKRKA